MAEQPGACLIGAHTPRYMTEIFDCLPAGVREVLRGSKYDLCSWCFRERLYQQGYNDRLRDQDMKIVAMRARKSMEIEIERTQRVA